MTSNRRASDILRTLTRNSLRRHRATTLTLVVFVALATMLAGSAGVLLVSATGASSALMTSARTPHFLQMHAGPVDEERMARFAAASPVVEDHAVLPMLNVDGAAIRVTGAGTDTTLAAGLQDNGFVTQSPSFDLLLDTDGAVIGPAPGTVWLPLFYRESLNLHGGELLTVTGPGGATELRVAGFLRDSQMNSAFASSKRLLVTPADLAALTATVGAAASIEHLVQFRLTDPAAAGELETQYRAAGLEANGPTLTWSLFVLVNSLSHGILAALLVLVTLLLVGIALLCVRFTLLTTLEQDHDQIAVLKAVGVGDGDLRRLYARRYLVIAGAGAGLGLLACWPLSRLLLADVHLFMGPSGRGLPAAGVAVVLAALVVAVVALALRRTLRHLSRLSPVAALRGSPGAGTRARRRWATRRPSITAARRWTNVRLGLRDLFARPGRYAVPLVIHTLTAFVLLVPQQLHATVTAPDFITSMGVGVADLRIDVQQPATPGRAAELDRALAADPDIARHAVLSTATYTAPGADGSPTTVKVESGDLAAFPLTYTAGSAPGTDTEVGLSRLQAEALGAVLGDTLVLTPALALDDGGQLALTVSGIYQDVTNGGHTAKMRAPHTSADLMWSSGYADVRPGTEVRAVVERYATANPDFQVSSVGDYVAATMGGVIDSLRAASIAAFAVGLLLSGLVTGLFQRLLIARDARRIAVLRALGLRRSHLQAQYVVRSVTVLVVGVLGGAVLAGVLGGRLAGLLLSSVGLARLDLVADPWTAYLATPLALLAVVVLVTLSTTRPGTRRTTPQTAAL